MQPVADLADVMVREFADVAFSGQPAASATVGVLDRAFLPRSGGVAEPRSRADLGPQVRP